MCDFDITSFREKPPSTAKSTKLDQNESAYALFLKKRKQLGLDDSDSDSDDDDGDKQKKKKDYSDSKYNNSDGGDSDASSESVNKASVKRKRQTDLQLEVAGPEATVIAKLAQPLQSTSKATQDTKMQQSIQADDTDQQSSIIVLCDDDVDINMAGRRKNENSIDFSSITTTQTTHKKRQTQVDFSLDIEDLDPELASLAAEEMISSTTSSLQPSVTVPQRVQIKVYYNSLYETNDPALKGVLETLSKPVKIIMMENDRFDTLLSHYCKRKHLMAQNMVLVYNNIRVVLRATPSSLNMSTEVINRLDVYKREEFEQKLIMEQEKKLARLSQLSHQIGYNCDSIEQILSVKGEEEEHEQEQEQETFLRIKLRGKDKIDIGLRVKPTTTIESMVKQYVKLRNMDVTLSSKIQLSFEGETLAPSTTIEDTDLEDEDMLTVNILA